MVLFLASVTIIGIYFCFFNKKSSVVSKPIVSKEGDSVGSVIFSNKFQMNSFREEMWWFNIAPIKDEDIKDLSQLKDLERLWIDSGSLTSNSIMELKKYGLKKLGLADIVMNRDHMVALSTLSGLEELHFIDNHIKDNRLYAELKKLGSLRLLLINSKDLDKNGIEVISSSTDLEGLSLSGCSRIDDSSVAAISRMKNLKRLSVSDTSVTREGILMLLKLLELEVLSIANCSCDKDCMKALVSRKMQKISVRKCKLNEEDVLMLAGIPTLKFLDCRDIPSITNFTMSRFHQIRAAKNYSSCQVHFQSSSVIQQLAEEIDSSLDDYYIWR